MQYQGMEIALQPVSQYSRSHACRRSPTIIWTRRNVLVARWDLRQDVRDEEEPDTAHYHHGGSLPM